MDVNIVVMKFKHAKKKFTVGLKTLYIGIITVVAKLVKVWDFRPDMKFLAWPRKLIGLSNYPLIQVRSLDIDAYLLVFPRNCK